MRKVAIALLRNASPSRHSHASSLKRDPASFLSFKTLATTQISKYEFAEETEDGEVGSLSELSMGASKKPTRKAMEKKEPRLKKEKTEGCCVQDLRGAEGPLHAEISTAKVKTKAKAKEKNAEDLVRVGVVEAENVTVYAQNAALGITEDFALCTKANASRSSVQEDLSEHIAILDLVTYKHGSRWEETAMKLLDYGIPLVHIINMLQKCRNLTCSVHWVDSTLKHFAMLGMSHEEMGRVISKWPTILNVTGSMFQSKIEFWESIGIDRHALGKILNATNMAILNSFPVLRRNAAFWKDYMKDVDANAVCIMTLKNPRLLSYNFIETKIAWLEAQAYDKKLLLKRSSILSRSLPTLISKALVLERLGILDARKRARALFMVSGTKTDKLQARFDNLLAVGFSHDQVQNIVLDCPTVLCLTEDNVNTKINYAVNVMNASLDVIVGASRGFWCGSLKTRIMYRYEVIKELQTLGALEGGVSLRYMVSMGVVDFKRRFVERFQDVVKHSDATNA